MEFRGCDSRDIFERVGLDLDAITDSAQRIPVEPVCKIWQLAEKEIKDSTFGLDVQRFITPTTFHALSIALWSSSTLKDALQRLVRFGRVLNNSSIKSFDESGESWCLTVSVLRDKDDQPLIAYQDLDAFFATIVTICRSIYRPNFCPVLLELERSQPSEKGKHEEFFQCQINFSASDNRMFFDKQQLGEALTSCDPEAALQAEALAAKRLSTLDKNNFSNQVYNEILSDLLTGNANEEYIASTLNLTLRQLQRKLSDEGTNFRRILDSTREELALTYIKNEDLPIIEIAYLVGFSEVTNFSRAFKRWTGKAPGAYRASLD
ncbi:MAG: AraC family transcriptional regulator [Verrucomicrobia bacterium]|nr:AraC family transcriptional regulator [Verrucomicrobiota bacterium]